MMVSNAIEAVDMTTIKILGGRSGVDLVPKKQIFKKN